MFIGNVEFIDIFSLGPSGVLCQVERLESKVSFSTVILQFNDDFRFCICMKNNVMILFSSPSGRKRGRGNNASIFGRPFLNFLQKLFFENYPVVYRIQILINILSSKNKPSI